MKDAIDDLRLQWAYRFFKIDSRGVLKPLNKKERQAAGLSEDHFEIAKKVMGYDS